MRELGYVEGKNLVLEIRGGEAEPDRLSDLAAELVRLRSTSSSPEEPCAPCCQGSDRTIPIVMRFGGDPVRYGLVASLARPGGNITGVAAMTLG